MGNLSNFVSQSNGNANTLGGHSAQYFIDNGGWGLNWIVKNSNYTASDGEGIIADTSSSAFTITLPASPSVGFQIKIAQGVKPFSVNNLTIGRNGHTIMGLSEDLIMNVDDSSVELVFDGSDWRIV
jgi:hypothetical protein